MTELTDFQKHFSAFLSDIDHRFNEPMSLHTSFRIGGNAELMAFPKSSEELSCLLRAAKAMGVTPRILGAGTNVLAPDEGIAGVVICLKDCMDGMERIGDTQLRVSAGVTMTRAAVYAANLGLSGLEFAHGIPGTVGGGVYMNAGAYGGEICQVCRSVDVMDMDGTVHTYTADEMKFSYRHSVLEDKGGIVLSAVFELRAASPEEIKAKMKELMAKRSASQPLDLPSAGSAFKRPLGGFAAALIDQTGLRGFTVGGAAISTKHAGFAVNLGGATANDVKSLLAQVSELVYERHQIRLEPEIRIW